MTRRRWTTGGIALALAPLLVLGALTLGPRVGPFGLLAPLPDARPLDYASRPDPGLSPLSARFIASVLGEPLRAGQRPPVGTAAGAGGPGVPAGIAGVTAQRLTDVHPLTNDDVRDARVVPSVPFTAKTDTAKATREPGEPGGCAAVGESTVWYRYDAFGDIGLVANTFGSNHATALAVYRGSPGRLTSLGCDSDVRGNAIVAFPAKKRVTYFFQIVGTTGGGDLVFSLDPQGVTAIESVSSSGEPADFSSYGASISPSGRYIAFESHASNLADGAQDNCRPPTPGVECKQVLVRDRTRSTVTLVSVDSNGRPGDGPSGWASISGDDRFVVFSSDATNLVPSDTNGVSDVFVHDLRTRRTERVSVSPSGVSGPALGGRMVAGAEQPTISWDGRYVAFNTRAALVPEDRNGTFDVYVRDRLTRRVQRVSVGSNGEEKGLEPAHCTGCETADTLGSSISADGRFVKFNTGSPKLVPDDTDQWYDTFVHDRLTHTTERVSVDSSGRPGGQGGSRAANGPERAFSSDARYVVFSTLTKLEPSDTNAADRFSGSDVYVHDRQTRRTFRASLSSTGRQTPPDHGSTAAEISGDGRYVAFQSDAPTLAPGDDNEVTDVFVRDLLTRTTIRVSVTTGGETTDGSATNPSLTADGRLVAYQSTILRTEYAPTTLPLISQVYAHERPRSGG